MKRLLSVLLCVALIVTMIPAMAWADDGIGPFPAELYWSKAPDNADGSEPKGIEWYSGEPLVMQEGESVRAYFGIETDDGIVAINADPSTIRTQEGVSISGRTNYMYTITAEGAGNFWILYDGTELDYEMMVYVEGDGPQGNPTAALYWAYVPDDADMTNAPDASVEWSSDRLHLNTRGENAYIYLAFKNSSGQYIPLGEDSSVGVDITYSEDVFELAKAQGSTYVYHITSGENNANGWINFVKPEGDAFEMGVQVGDGNSSNNNMGQIFWLPVQEADSLDEFMAAPEEFNDCFMRVPVGGFQEGFFAVIYNGNPVLLSLNNFDTSDVSDKVAITEGEDGALCFEFLKEGNFEINASYESVAYRIEAINIGAGSESDDPDDSDLTQYNLSMEVLADTSEWPDASERIMWHYGQGDHMLFNSKITSWYSCFYVQNATTGYDARFEWTPGNPNEVRTYVGADGEYVIQAALKDGNWDWKPITEVANEYRVFTIEYLGNVKGAEYDPLFKIDFNAELDDENDATETYEYRLWYTGEDEYLDNGNHRNSRAIILYRDEDLVDFNVDEYWYDENGNLNTGNVLRFDYVGEAIKFNLNIRPGILKSAADKKIYGEDDYIYIEPSETNGAQFIDVFEYRHDEWIPIPDDENPFVITWDDTEKLYTITYAEPDEDLHGPHYRMTYTGDYDTLINQKYGYEEGTKSSVGADSTFTTGKITVHVDDVGNGSIDATTDDEVIGTEVVLGGSALDGYNKDELHFETNDGSITLGGALVGNIKITDKKIHLKMWNVKEDDYLLNDEQKKEVKKCVKAFDFKIDTKDADIEFGEDGYATIRIPYDGSKGYIYYINDKGEKEYIDCVTKNGYIEFTAKHFSTYAISTEMPEDGDPDYKLEIDMPGTMNYWLPDVNGELWTNLYELIQDDDNSWWKRVNGHTLVPTVTMTHVCNDKADATWSEGEEDRAFKLQIPDSCVKGCEAFVEVRAFLNDEFIRKGTFNVHVTDEMYRIEYTGTEFKNLVEMGEVLNFKDALTVEKVTPEKDWTEVANPTFSMTYDEECWEIDGEGINGLYNLKKISPYGDGVDVKVIVGGKEVAHRDYGFEGYDFWTHFEEDDRIIFGDQETASFTLRKSGELATDKKHDIEFVLGQLKGDTFTEVKTQNQAVLFTKITDEDGIVTGIKLNPSVIRNYVNFNDDGECRLGVKINIKYKNTDTVYTLSEQEIWFYKDRQKYDPFGDEVLLPGDDTWIGHDVWGFDYEHMHDGWMEITDLEVSDENSAYVQILGNQEEGWRIKALKLSEKDPDGQFIPVVVTVKHKTFDGQIKSQYLKVYIVDDLWRCEVDAVSRVADGDDLKIDFDARAYHLQYENGGTNETGENYKVKWSIETFNNTVASIDPDTGVVTAANDSDGEFRVKYDVYTADAVIGTDEPVCSGGYHFAVDETFYTFDISAEKNGQPIEMDDFENNFAVGETIQITHKISKHYMDGSEPITEAVDASFDWWYDRESDGNVISVEEAKVGNTRVYNVTRKTEGDAGIAFWAHYENKAENVDWGGENWYFVQRITRGPSTETDIFYTYVLEDGKYVRLEKEAHDRHEGYAEYLSSDNGDGDNEFFVLYPKAGQADKPELDVFEVEGFDNIPIEEEPDYVAVLDGITIDDTLGNETIDGTEYFVWKVSVDDDFGMVKAGLTLSSLEDFTHVMFILGEAFYVADERNYNDGIFAVSEVAQGKNWDSIEDLVEDETYLAVFDDYANEYRPEINLNLSQVPSSERNTFYILHRVDTELRTEVSKLYPISLVNGSGLGGAKAFEQCLDTDEMLVSTTAVDENGDPIIVTIDGTEYEATQVNLTKYLGHSDMFLYMANKDNRDEYIRARITFGMDVYFEGELKGIKSVGPVWNEVDRMMGNEPDFPDFEFTEHEDGSISAYFSEACGITDDYGQGRVCSMALDLKPGYVVTEITNGTDPQVFLADIGYYYDVFDKYGNLLDTREELYAAGWHTFSSDSTDRKIAGAIHRVATYGIDGVGEESVSEFKDFLDGVGDYAGGEKYTAKKLGAFIDYNIYFDKSQYAGETAGTTRIVYHIERPKEFRGSKVSVHGNNNIKVDAVENVDFDKKKGNKNVEQLEGEGLEIKRVYDMTTNDVVEGFVCIAISETELDGGNLEDYTVVYFTAEGVPIEMETTYVEGEGIVFTTGHFSEYAVIGKICKHDMIKTDAKAATCTDDGNVEYYTCSVCKKNFADEEGQTELEKVVIDAFDHDMQLTSDKVEAKCEEEGKEAIYTCANNCGKTEGGETIPALQHNMQLTSEKVEAKCEEEGREAVYTCANGCGKTEGGEEIPALQHNMQLTSEKVEAKCEEEGTEAVYTCANGCGKTEGGEVIPALQHDMQLIADKVEAKCEVAGKEAVYTCANECGKTEGGEVIPALQHDMQLIADKVEAKCEVAGKEAVYICANGCGKTSGGEEIPALKHDYDGGDTCKHCGEPKPVTPPSGGGTVIPPLPVVPPVPSTPKDEVTNDTGNTESAPSTSADLSQSTTSKGNETTTTVDQTIADKIVEKAVSNKSEEVVIDATYHTESSNQSTKSATVEVPTETIAQIAEKTEAAVTIKTDVAEIKLDTEALAAVAEQAEGKSVSVVAEKVKADTKEIRVELKIVCSEGKTISDFKGGNISVTVEAPKGKKDVVCVYIDENGHWHTVPGQLNADGTYTFTTGHFSTYAIVDAEHAADTIAAQKEAVKNVQLKLRSANDKTSKGKKAIKLTISEVTKTGIDFDGYVIYRSTKKTSGFKKIYTTKTGTYFNTSAKKGVKYYYKAKGFVTIDGEKVYTGWSKKAIRTAK